MRLFGAILLSRKISVSGTSLAVWQIERHGVKCIGLLAASLVNNVHAMVDRKPGERFSPVYNRPLGTTMQRLRPICPSLN